MQQILGQDFIGAYLQGSFGIGDFDQHSDVDFIVVVEDELTPDQVEALQEMHDQIYQLDSEWAKHLEGSYFPRAILHEPPKRGEKLWYLDHGARLLVQSDHCNTLLVRWVVREKGVRLASQPPRSLLDPIEQDALRAEMFETITNWGQQILADPSSYSNRFYQGFIVLSYCRMLHDLHRGYPGSKREGAEWAKSVLDPSLSALIDGSWDSRPDPAHQIRKPADQEAFEKTLRFVEHIMQESRAYLTEENYT
jgi:hypothetical protein